MRVYVDTSVLVALTIQVHPFKELVDPQLIRKDTTLVVGLHVFAEYYSTLTKKRLPYALTPELAAQQLDLLQSSKFIEIFEPKWADYARAIELSSLNSLVSGGIYDGLHVACAEGGACKKLFTLNGKDFQKMEDDTEVEIVALR